MISRIYLYTREQLQEFLNESSSYTEILNKCGLDNIGSNNKTLKRIIDEHNLDTTTFFQNSKEAKSNTKPREKKNLQDIFENKDKYVCSGKLLRRLIKEGHKEHMCEQCKNTTWNEKPIALELNHVDGNRDNNSPENLQLLCPNCHAQTDNWRGRKKRKKITIPLTCKTCGKNIKSRNKTGLCKKCLSSLNKEERKRTRRFDPTKEELLHLVERLPLTKIGKIYGVTDNAIKKRCKLYEIDLRPQGYFQRKDVKEKLALEQSSTLP